MYVDIALKAREQYVALQMVREHEHSCNTGQLLGTVQFTRAVLEKNGWEVKHMRYVSGVCGGGLWAVCVWGGGLGGGQAVATATATASPYGL